MPLPSPIDAYDQLIIDLDGCVWIGSTPIAGAAEAIAALRAAGKRIAFVTNDARIAGEDYVRKLWSAGIQASLKDVVTVGAATQHLLAETRQGRTGFAIGTEAFCRHVSDAGVRLLNRTDLASRAELVVVAGTDRLDYSDLRNAVLALRRGADFIATCRDPTFPMPDGPWPGTGAILAAVEYGSGRTAEIVGKPETRLFTTALERLGDGRTLVVGDRLDADIAAARRAELDSALVLSGGSSENDLDSDGDCSPTFVADSLGALVAGGGRPGGG